MPTNLDNIYYFCVVVNHRSYVKASEHTDISISSLSRRIARLEQDLEVSLLDRNSRNLRLTAAGKLLFKNSNKQLSLVKKQAQTLMEDADELSGQLLLNMPVFLGHKFLSPWLAEFQKQHPKLQICLDTSNKNINLLKDDVDLVIRYGPLVDSSLIARPIFTPDMAIVGSASYLNSHPINTHAHLTDARWMKIHSQSSLVTLLDPKNKTIEINSNARSISNDLQVLIDFVAAGLGIAVLPQFLLGNGSNLSMPDNAMPDNAMPENVLVHVLPAYQLTSTESFYAVYPSKSHLSKKTARLVEYLIDRFSSQGKM